MTLQRYLDGFEAVSRNMPLVYVAEYSGHIDEGHLRRAFELLSVQHPSLRGRIRQDDRGYLLHVQEDYRPEVVGYEDDETAYIREAGGSWDCAQALARLALVQLGGRGFVVLRLDHAIADRRGGLALWGKLWRYLTDVANGVEVSADSNASLPASPRELLSCLTGYRPAPASAPASSDSHDAESSGAGSAIRRRVLANKEDTARLIRIARSHETSVHGLIGGAILIAQRSLDAVSNEPEPMVFWSAVDLRGRMDPPIAPTATTNMVAIHKAEVAVAADSDPIALGREVKDKLNEAIARTELGVDAMTAIPPVVSDLEHHVANAFVSNVGVVPRLDEPNGVKVTDFRLLRFGAELIPFYRVYTYDGRLNVDLSFPSDYTMEQVEQVQAQIEAQLRDAKESVRQPA